MMKRKKERTIASTILHCYTIEFHVGRQIDCALYHLLIFSIYKKKEQSDSIMKGRIRMPFDASIYPFFMSVHLSIYHSVHLCSLYKLVAMDRLCKSFPQLGRRTLLQITHPSERIPHHPYHHPSPPFRPSAGFHFHRYYAF